MRGGVPTTVGNRVFRRFFEPQSVRTDSFFLWAKACLDLTSGDVQVGPGKRYRSSLTAPEVVAEKVDSTCEPIMPNEGPSRNDRIAETFQYTPPGPLTSD